MISKMQEKKTYISILLSAVLILSLIFCGVTHAEEATGTIRFKYNFNKDNQLIVTGYSNKTGSPDVVIPDSGTYMGTEYLIVGIDCFDETSAPAFRNMKAASVTLGKNITYIGDYSFQNCTLTGSFISSESLKSIGIGAFENFSCSYMYIPGSVETIQSKAFSGTHIRYFELPTALKNLASDAFDNDETLTIKIPTTLTELAPLHLENYSKVTFELTEDASKEAVQYFEENNLQYKVGENGEIHYPAITTEITTTEQLTEASTELTTEKTTEVSTETTTEQSSEVSTEVSTTEQLTEASTELTTEKTTEVSTETTTEQSSEASTEVSTTEQPVDSTTAENTTQPGGTIHNSFNQTTNNNIINSTDNSTHQTVITTVNQANPSNTEDNQEAAVGDVELVNGLSYKVTGKDTVSYIGTKAVRSNLKIPDLVTIQDKNYKVTKIENGACRNNAKVTKITIGNNVRIIGTNSFANCKNLKQIVIGQNVKTIGANAFRKNGKLIKIVFKTSSLKSIGKKAFYKVPSTAKIQVPSGKKNTYKKLIRKSL